MYKNRDLPRHDEHVLCCKLQTRNGDATIQVGDFEGVNRDLCALDEDLDEELDELSNNDLEEEHDGDEREAVEDGEEAEAEWDGIVVVEIEEPLQPIGSIVVFVGSSQRVIGDRGHLVQKVLRVNELCEAHDGNKEKKNKRE